MLCSLASGREAAAVVFFRCKLVSRAVANALIPAAAANATHRAMHQDEKEKLYKFHAMGCGVRRGRRR
jgi:hypothetical protein